MTASTQFDAHLLTRCVRAGMSKVMAVTFLNAIGPEKCRDLLNTPAEKFYATLQATRSELHAKQVMASTPLEASRTDSDESDAEPELPEEEETDGA